jgi:Ca2+-binding EF-hand superfamily protein
MTLDGEMKKYGLIEKTDLKKLWRRLDYNGNNIVSLAEIDKMVSDLTSNGVWPAYLNSKPALMRAYKKTILKDGDGDDWVEKKEFHALLLNIFWFGKLFQIFQAVDTGADRRIDVNEFCAGLSQLGLNMSPQEASAEFSKIDQNHGGQVLFVELCAYVRKRVNPDDNANFDADIMGGEHCEKAGYFTSKGTVQHHGFNSFHHGEHQTLSNHELAMAGMNNAMENHKHHIYHQHAAPHHHSHHHSPHVHTRDLDFSSMMGPGGMPMGAPGSPMGAPSSPMQRSLGGPCKSCVNTLNSHTDTLRMCGDKATTDLHVKPKAMKDFDELEGQLKAMVRDHQGLVKAWKDLDFNGNGVVSLAEMGKWTNEHYPLLNHAPALQRTYWCTIAGSSHSHHDGFIHKVDFKRMLLNVFYFNKLFWVFDQCDGDDRRITLQEFKQVMTLCGVNMSPGDLQQEFNKCDKNGGGIILFDEFCHYFASKVCPEGLTAFTDDGFDRTHIDGTAKTVTGQHVTYVTGQHGHAQYYHGHGGRY